MPQVSIMRSEYLPSLPKPVPVPFNNGCFYTFTPFLKADGSPQGSGEKVKNLEFDRGWYIGYREGAYIFFGRPVGGSGSYFFDLPEADGQKAVLDPNQHG